ncbi:MAG: L,D-transpeptidase family protein [Calditerricola sp.]|nr:L,D-transpeptidase family protein [Calditerricola sp.]
MRATLLVGMAWLGLVAAVSYPAPGPAEARAVAQTTTSAQMEQVAKPVREIHIDLWKRRLHVLENGVVIKTYPIGPGASATPTPIGEFRVVTKSRNWGGGFGTRWLGLNVPWGIYGIHGTNRPHLIGGYVSHGCIRMRNRDVEELYELIPHGTRVVIDGPLFGYAGVEYRKLVRGDRGSLVVLVQNRLQAAGFYAGRCHGVFDGATEDAVKRFQRDWGMPVTGQVDWRDYVALGLIE